MKPSKREWKTFRETLPDLRERYLAKRNKALISILSNEERTATEQFWDTFDAMEKEGKILRDCLDGYSKSSMNMHILYKLRHGIMKDEDLEPLSNELRSWVDKVKQA